MPSVEDAATRTATSSPPTPRSLPYASRAVTVNKPSAPDATAATPSPAADDDAASEREATNVTPLWFAASTPPMKISSVYAPASYAVTETVNVPSLELVKTHATVAFAATAFPLASVFVKFTSHVASERPVEFTEFPCASRAESVAVRSTPTRPPNNASPASVAPEVSASAAAAETATVAGDPNTCSPPSRTETTCVPAFVGVSATSTTPLALICV